jgi:hypothetical protein
MPAHDHVRSLTWYLITELCARSELETPAVDHVTSIPYCRAITFQSFICETILRNTEHVFT